MKSCNPVDLLFCIFIPIHASSDGLVSDSGNYLFFLKLVELGTSRY